MAIPTSVINIERFVFDAPNGPDYPLPLRFLTLGQEGIITLTVRADGCNAAPAMLKNHDARIIALQPEQSVEIPAQDIDGWTVNAQEGDALCLSCTVPAMWRA